MRNAFFTILKNFRTIGAYLVGVFIPLPWQTPQNIIYLLRF